MQEVLRVLLTDHLHWLVRHDDAQLQRSRALQALRDPLHLPRGNFAVYVAPGARGVDAKPRTGYSCFNASAG
ncbi:MAG: hypothetical protein ABI434_23585 [Burkholderiaceae bacterium]